MNPFTGDSPQTRRRLCSPVFAFATVFLTVPTLPKPTQTLEEFNSRRLTTLTAGKMSCMGQPKQQANAPESPIHSRNMDDPVVHGLQTDEDERLREQVVPPIATQSAAVTEDVPERPPSPEFTIESQPEEAASEIGSTSESNSTPDKIEYYPSETALSTSRSIASLTDSSVGVYHQPTVESDVEDDDRKIKVEPQSVVENSNDGKTTSEPPGKLRMFSQRTEYTGRDTSLGGKSTLGHFQRLLRQVHQAYTSTLSHYSKIMSVASKSVREQSAASRASAWDALTSSAGTVLTLGYGSAISTTGCALTAVAYPLNRITEMLMSGGLRLNDYGLPICASALSSGIGSTGVQGQRCAASDDSGIERVEPLQKAQAQSTGLDQT